MHIHPFSIHLYSVVVLHLFLLLMSPAPSLNVQSASVDPAPIRRMKHEITWNARNVSHAVGRSVGRSVGCLAWLMEPFSSRSA